MTEPHSLTLAESDFDPDALELIVTVPHDEADSDTDGLKLGDALANIRARGTYVKGKPERQAQLNALGMEWGSWMVE